MRRDAPLLVVVGEHRGRRHRRPTHSASRRSSSAGSIAGRARRPVTPRPSSCSPCAAGCGGGDDEASGTTTTTTGSTACEEVDAPEARERVARGADRAARRRSLTYTLDLRHELRLVHGDARPRVRTEHDRVARRARGARVLRRHDLPPRRVRASSSRAATRRRREPAAPATRRSTCRRRMPRTRRASSRWRSRRRRHQEPPGASSSSSRARTWALRPTTRSSARSRRAWTPSSGSTRSRRRQDGPPSQPVVVESVTVGRADGTSRRGRPRGRRGVAVRRRRSSSSSSHACSSGCTRRPSTRSSSSRAPTSSTRGRRPGAASFSCPDWERGPGASLRCGLAALDETSRRRS